MNRATTTSFSVPGLQAVKIPLSALAITYTPENVTDMANKANDGLDKVSLFGTTIPLVLLILGLIAIGASVPMIRHRKEQPPSTPTTPDKRPSPTERAHGSLLRHPAISAVGNAWLKPPIVCR